MTGPAPIVGELATPAPPSVLYRYRTPEHALSEIADNYLWFTHPRDFNDPLDCALARERDDYREDELRAFIREHWSRGDSNPMRPVEHDPTSREMSDGLRKTIHQSFEDHERRTREDMGVCCLAETYDNPLMWAHCAGGHKGVCLAFDTTHHPIDQCAQVVYVNDVPVVDLLKYARTPDDAEEFARQTLLAKAFCWSYEREWRLITSGEQRVPLGPMALKGVLLGVRVDLTFAESVKKAAAERAVPVYKGTLKRLTLGIEFRLLDHSGTIYDPAP